MPTASSASARGTYQAGGGRFARPLDLPSSRALSRSTPNLSSDKRRRQRAVSHSPSPPRHDCGVTTPGVYSFRAKPAPSFVLTPVTPTYSRQQYLSQFSEQRPPYGVDGDSGRDVPFYPPSLHPHSPEAQIRIQRLRDTRRLYRSPASRRAAAGSVDDLLKDTRPHRDPCSAVHHTMPCRARFGALSSSVPAHLHHLHRRRSKGSTRDASVGSTDSLYIVEPYGRSQSTMALVEQPLTEATQTEGMSTDSLNASTRSMPGLHVGVGTDVGTREISCETDWVFGEGRGKKKTKTRDTGMNTRPIRERKSDTVRETKKARVLPANRRAIKGEKTISGPKVDKVKIGATNKSRSPDRGEKKQLKHQENGGMNDYRKGEGRDRRDGRGKFNEGNIEEGNSKIKVGKAKSYGERYEVDKRQRETDRGNGDIDEVFYLDTTGGGMMGEGAIKGGERDGMKRDVTDHDHSHDSDNAERSKSVLNRNESLFAISKDGQRSFYISPDHDQAIAETMSKSYPDFRNATRTSQFGEISTIFESDREAEAAEGSSRQRPDLRHVPKKANEDEQRGAVLAGQDQDKSGDQDEETIAESHISSSEARSSILDSDLDVMPREMPTDPADLRHVEKRRSSLLKVATDDTEQDSNSEYYLFPGEQSTASGVTNTPVGPGDERVSTWFHKNIFYQSFPVDGGAEVLMPGDEMGPGIRVASVQIAITRIVHNPNVHVEPPDHPTIVSTLTYPIRQLYPLPMSNHLHPVVTTESGRHGIESCPSRVVYEVDKQGTNHPLKMKWTVVDAHQNSTQDVGQKTAQGHRQKQKPVEVQATRIPVKTAHPTVSEVNPSMPSDLPNQSYLEQLTSGNRDKVKETAKDKPRTIEAKAVPATSATDRNDTPPDLIPRPTSPVPPKHTETRSARPVFENPISKSNSEPQKKTKSPRPDSLNLVPNYESVYLKSNRQSALDFWRQREATSRAMAPSKSISKRNALNTSVGSSYQQRRNF